MWLVDAVLCRREAADGIPIGAGAPHMRNREEDCLARRVVAPGEEL
jgi:hypothetical protein